MHFQFQAGLARLSLKLCVFSIRYAILLLCFFFYVHKHISLLCLLGMATSRLEYLQRICFQRCIFLFIFFFAESIVTFHCCCWRLRHLLTLLGYVYVFVLEEGNLRYENFVFFSSRSTYRMSQI